MGWTNEYKIQRLPGSGWDDYTGTVPINLSATPAVPAWHGLTTLTYQFAPIPVSVGVRWRYIAAMKDISTVLNPASTIPGADSYSYLDVVGSWKITDRIELNSSITNVTGHVPPTLSATDGMTQTALYDIDKLTYLLSLHAKF